MSREDVEARLLALSPADRNLLRMYNQLPIEEVMKQALQFGEYLKFLEPNERNSNADIHYKN
jgi:hypothetical protein